MFRVDGDNIECLQDATARKFVAPFKDEKYNRLENFSQYVKATARNRHTVARAKDYMSVQDLIKGNNIVIEIQPTKITKATPLVYDTKFTVLKEYRGSCPRDYVFLPRELDVSKKYIIFLEEVDDGDGYYLVSRNSIFSEEDKEYTIIKDALSK
ncbi:MAG: hypothetical protein GX090_01480 [Firmicutes bacterium]|nr:hypothetical protein [Bacillota bacterium]